MIIAYWITAALLAVVYLAAGSTKLFRNKEQLFKMGQTWVENVHPAIPKLVGVLEILGALGVLLPAFTTSGVILAPIAAVGLVLLQAVAIGIHIRMNDVKTLPVNVILLALAFAVAWLGAINFVG